MRQALFPVLVYTQFHNGPLPPKSIDRLLEVHIDDALKFFISLKGAILDTSRRNIDHPLIKQLYGILPMHYIPKIGTFEESRLTIQTVLLDIILDLINAPRKEKSMHVKLTPKFFIDAFNTILIYNEHHFREVYKTGRELTHDDIWAFALMQEINAEHPLAYSRVGIAKQLIFNHFLKVHFGASYPTIEGRILKTTGTDSLNRIILTFIDLELSFQAAIKNLVPLVIIGPGDERYSLLEKLGLVIECATSTGKLNLAQLVTAPFLKLTDGNLYLTGTADFGLITTKAWDKYLVDNKILIDVLPHVSKMEQLQGYWGKEYYEGFLLSGLLGSLQKTGLRVIKTDDPSWPDALIVVNEKDVFVIEIKSSSLHYNVTNKQDIAGYRLFIDENFVAGKKGVSQLNRYIEELTKIYNSRYQIHNPPGKLRVYPIIIYTEPHLTKIGVNDYVNVNGPKLPKDIKSAFQYVEDVTMIPADFFIDNISLLQKDRSLLRTSIVNYHQELRAARRKYDGSKDPKDYFKIMNSFEASVIARNGMYRNEYMTIFNKIRVIFDLK